MKRLIAPMVLSWVLAGFALYMDLNDGNQRGESAPIVAAAVLITLGVIAIYVMQKQRPN